jgi:(2Fe-2S) ferredoxin
VEREFEKQLGIHAGETTPDREFTLETVNCLGACALGPIVVTDGRYFSNVSTGRVDDVISETRKAADGDAIKTDQRIFPVKVHCPRCNHTLMDPAHKINDHPSIRVTMSIGHRHGWLRLSSLYGVHSQESEYEIPDNEVAHVFCPHCHAELNGGTSCPECAAPAVPMLVRSGGMVQICSRRGCHWHRLDVG